MFDPRFLEDLRARVPITSVAKRHFTIQKVGHEFRAKENKSLTFDDKKGIYKDFGGGGGKASDVFGFLVEYEKLSFPDAVAAVARMAGVDVPKQTGAKTYGNGAAAAVASAARPAAIALGAGRQITKVYPYTDRDGKLLYQVCRSEWLDDAGKKLKTFNQRRPSPDSDGVWVWGLDFVDVESGEPHAFMRKGAGKDWSRLNEKNYVAWKFTEKTTFGDFGNVPHSLYRLKELNEELSQERCDQRTIFLAEGEKDTDTLVGWDCIATTNSGGAKNFTPYMAEFFRDAADVVLLEENDDAGRARTALVAPMLLDVGARVRVLVVVDHWPDAPKGGDITDWVEKAGGTVDRLFDILDRCPDWAPKPYESKFGAKFWNQQGTGQDLAYKWLVSGLIPYGQDALIIGPSGSGKSFETQNLAMHIAQGRDYLGRRTMAAGVVYCCYEMASSMEKRVIGYRMFHGLSADDPIPFVWITRPPNLYATEENPQSLAAEIKSLTAHWTVPIGAIVIDTHNAATRGSSEIKSEDIAKVQDAYSLVRAATGATLVIVGHTNSEGRHRGSDLFFNAIETCIVIEKLTTGSGKSLAMVRDDLGRQVRRGTLSKSRESEDGFTWDFVLQSVEVSRDELGDPITTVVPIEPQQSDTADQSRERKEWRGDMPKRVWKLNADETVFFRALIEAVNTAGVAPPAEAKGVPSFAGVVATWKSITEAYRRMVPIDDTSEDGRKKYLSKITAKMSRARTILQNNRVIGVTSVIKEGEPPEAATHYLWPGDRPVIGGTLRWPEREWERKPKVEADPLLADVADYKSPF